MRKRLLRSIIVSLIAVMVVTMMPLTASAATKKPGKVKISSLSVTAVSPATNKCTITIKWKKASNAKGYIIYAKHGDGSWVKQKKVGKSVRKLKLTGCPAGQLQIRIRAVNKKKYGKYSNIKSRYIASPLTVQQYADRIEPSMKSNSNGVKISYSGNQMKVEYDVEVVFSNLDIDWDNPSTEVINELHTDLVQNSNLKKAATDTRNSLKKNCGISNFKFIASYVYKGTALTSISY